MIGELSPEQKEERKGRIQRQRSSGLSTRGWRRQDQVPANRFYYWERRLFPKALSRSSFTELSLQDPLLESGWIC